MILLLSSHLFADENIIRFSNISWETTPEQILLIEGLPDIINYDYDDNGEVFQISSEIVWINSTVEDNDILRYVERRNIPIGDTINVYNIINNHNKIKFRYNNVLLNNINLTVFLNFENDILKNKIYIIDTLNLTNIEKQNISIYLTNLFMQLYGTSEHTVQHSALNEYIWLLNNTIINLQIFLPQDDIFYSGFNYIDTISFYYWYIR